MIVIVSKKLSPVIPGIPLTPSSSSGCKWKLEEVPVSVTDLSTDNSLVRRTAMVYVILEMVTSMAKSSFLFPSVTAHIIGIEQEQLHNKDQRRYQHQQPQTKRRDQCNTHRSVSKAVVDVDIWIQNVWQMRTTISIPGKSKLQHHCNKTPA